MKCRICNKNIEGIKPLDKNKPNTHQECYDKELKEAYAKIKLNAVGQLDN